MAIQLRRGHYDNMDANALLDAELCVTTGGDPNVSDGRGFYIKNGTLKRVLTEEDDSQEFKYFTLVDTVTVNSSTTSVDLFSYDSQYNEYMIVIDATLSSSSGVLMLNLVGDTIAFTGVLPAVKMCVCATLKKLTASEVLVSTNSYAKTKNISALENQIIQLTTGAISITGGTIKIYAR